MVEVRKICTCKQVEKASKKFAARLYQGRQQVRRHRCRKPVSEDLDTVTAEA